MSLDPDDSRPPYVQVANALRAAILTKKFSPGDKLPSGKELAKQYGVARMTVQQALRLLREENLIVSRHGSGVFVRQRTEKPVGLRPYVEQAFERDHVAIDFAGLSGETLQGAIQEPLDKIRAGRITPQTVTIRVLVPDTSTPWALPVRVDDQHDEPAYRRRIDTLFSRHVGAMADAIGELDELGLISEASVQVRTHALTPLFKLYLLNDEEMFFGFYPIYARTIETDAGAVEMYDLGGKDAVLFHQSATDDPNAPDTQHVAQAREWFDSIWNTMSRERAL
ncbi:GntR family transcriptional regulator [Phytoactinopolyspora limicola]|uniref:GntR family transcriptional regulator n=1 Tax=Phytoactinopolyspora limicola TaxID=2715536 RepID=UPI001A9C9A0F|nr:winged helix-turn-helix domain-containing protein [Phytoactinopolyspora limicola]